MSLIDLQISDRKNLIFTRVLAFIFIPGMIWGIFTSIEEFNLMMDKSSAPVEYIENRFEIGNLKLTKTQVDLTGDSKIVLYVTSKDLQYTASNSKQQEIISSNFGFTKMTGLESFGSFLVSEENESFWISQFYLEIIFRYRGLTLIFTLLFFYAEVNIRQGKKLFTKEIKWFLLALYGLVFFAYLIKAFLYGRMILFLNRNYSIGESVVGGLSQELFWLLIPLLFLIIFIEKAIPIQQEQDLTV